MTDSTIMLALGDYRFSISTAAYQSLQRTTEYRWAKQERLGVKPGLQFVGPGEDKIEFHGTIYPSFIRQRQGLAQVAYMREAAALGTPLLMVDGAGRVWGLYVIETITEEQTTFFSDGTPRKIDFSLSLCAYGE